MLQTLDRGLTIMKYLAMNNSVSVSEIASTFNIPKSTASRIISTLAHHGFACQRGADKRYKLGIGMLMFGSQMLNDNRLLEEYRPLMRQVQEMTGEMIHLAVWYGSQVYTVELIRGKEHASMRNVAVPGMPVPLYDSAAGKLLLAFLPEEEQQVILEKMDGAQCDAIKEELRCIRAREYTVEQEETQPRVFSAAIPVYDPRGTVRFALALTSGRNFLQQQEKTEYYLQVMRQCADKMKKKINSSFTF